MKNFDFATATRLDLEIWDTQNKIKYIKLPTRKPRKEYLILTLSLLQLSNLIFFH